MNNITELNSSALRLFADVSVGDNGANAKSAPVKIVARTSDPVDIPGFGKIVHDFATMSHKPRIPLDYCHEYQESIGYLNKFAQQDGNLVCDGAIVPYKDDKGAEVLHKMSQGVPYEASIETGDDITLEPVEAGENVVVNNRQYTGPLYVVRDWGLKAVAVAKFGRDSGTSTDLTALTEKNRKVSIKYLVKGESMENTQKAVEAAEVKAVEATKLTEVKSDGEATKAVEPETVEAKVEAVVAPAVEQARPAATPLAVEAKSDEKSERVELKRYMATFGDLHGAKFYAEGMSFENALVAHAKSLSDENADLKKRLAAIDRGEAKPVKFSAADDSKSKGGMQAVIRRQGS